MNRIQAERQFLERVEKLLDTMDPDQCWHYTGPLVPSHDPLKLYQFMTPGRPGKRRKRRYIEMNIKLHHRRPMQIAPLVSYRGVNLTPMRALFAHFRAADEPRILPTKPFFLPKTFIDYTVQYRRCSPYMRLPRCMNPFHVELTPLPLPSIPEPILEATFDDAPELAQLMEEWFFRNHLAPASLFSQLYIEPGDWSRNTLIEATALLTTRDALTPRWRGILKELLQ